MDIMSYSLDELIAKRKKEENQKRKSDKPAKKGAQGGRNKAAAKNTANGTANGGAARKKKGAAGGAAGAKSTLVRQPKTIIAKKPTMAQVVQNNVQRASTARRNKLNQIRGLPESKSQPKKKQPQQKQPQQKQPQQKQPQQQRPAAKEPAKPLVPSQIKVQVRSQDIGNSWDLDRIYNEPAPAPVTTTPARVAATRATPARVVPARSSPLVQPRATPVHQQSPQIRRSPQIRQSLSDRLSPQIRRSPQVRASTAPSQIRLPAAAHMNLEAEVVEHLDQPNRRTARRRSSAAGLARLTHDDEYLSPASPPSPVPQRAAQPNSSRRIYNPPAGQRRIYR